ncbi:tetratricopeptide repeat protein [Vagococcus xieshaowenii]|uniref:Tetratricopeptide repeat protein n=1 Tax=Vagococcus xieshaowenii TaxID=2562451 RepID=A0AAJ5EEV1_9ENTE|nr:hypothetical protein [Vagococcus xieshaowenii]QCA28311.1 hypothetical protein E4Z98_02915 [Vagococcus xieshaowenii]TFZ42301.1 hypothetical protein E4031_03735 [Vagococcus xieshaowenii]
MNKGIIEMPENYQHHMTLGQIAFEEERFNEALNHFQLAYNLENQLEANRWLVKSALVLNEYALAETVMEERLNDYLTDNDSLRLYIEALVGLKKFQRARLFIEVYAQGTSKEELMVLLNQMEEQTVRFEGAKVQKSIGKLSSWYPEPHEITSFLEQLNQLPYESFLKLVTQVLADANHSLMLRNQLLNMLTLLKVEQHVKILNYKDEWQEVSPKELEVLGRETTYLQVSAILNKLVGEQPNVLNQLLADQRRFFNILYPLAQQEIQSIENWLSVTLAPYNGVVRLPIDQQLEEDVEELDVFNIIIEKMGLKK